MKPRIACIVLAIPSFLLSVGAVGQQVLTPDEILARGAAAMGSGSGLITTIEVTGTYTFARLDGDESYPFRFKAEGYRNIRWEIDGPEGTVVTVIRGNSGWTRFNGRIRALPIGQIAGRRFEWLPILGLVEWLEDTSASMVDNGSEVRGGMSLRRLTLSRIAENGIPEKAKQAIESARQAEYSFDEATGLPVRVSFQSSSRDWRVTSTEEFQFSNFQQLGGLLIPLTITKLRGGQRTEEIQIHTLQPNVTISSEEFRR